MPPSTTSVTTPAAPSLTRFSAICRLASREPSCQTIQPRKVYPRVVICLSFPGYGSATPGRPGSRPVHLSAAAVLLDLGGQRLWQIVARSCQHGGHEDAPVDEVGDLRVGLSPRILAEPIGVLVADVPDRRQAVAVQHRRLDDPPLLSSRRREELAHPLLRAVADLLQRDRPHLGGGGGSARARAGGGPCRGTARRLG